MKIVFRLLILTILLALTACTSNTVENFSIGSAVVVKEGGKIYIVDRDGERWDVTYGVENLGFFAERFDKGNGRDQFTPITDPQFHLPGDADYPGIGVAERVIGFELDGDSRAYPTDALRGIEIANDSFGDTHVAVGW